MSNPDSTAARDIQQLDGPSWRSVHTVRDADVTDPAEAIQEWLNKHRVKGAAYRVVRTVKTGVITVEPIPAKD